MQEKESSVCFSGHRNERLPQRKADMEKLKVRLWEEIDDAMKDGFNTFYVGACYGWDLFAAEIILKRKRVIKLAEPKIIRLIAVVPYEEQSKNWKEENREIYYDTLAQCDEVITLNTHYKQGCYHERNRYMVDRCSRLICYYDGGGGGTSYTVKYAETKQLEIKNLYMD